MNLRRALGWFHRRLVTMAEAGTLRVRHGGKWVDVIDEDDIDAWLVGDVPPSLVRRREQAPAEYAAAGVEIG